MVRGVFVSRKEAESTTLAEDLDRYEREVSSGKKPRQGKICDRPLAKMFFGFQIPGEQQILRSIEWRDDRLLSSPMFSLLRPRIGEWGGYSTLCRMFVGQILPPRNRRLFPDELERILASTESGSLGDVIFLAIETGMRRGEIARMRREHVDLKKKVLLIPDTKTQTPRILGLSDEVAHMLKNLPHRLDGKIWGYDDKGLGITRVFQEACKRTRKSYEKECEENKEINAMKPLQGSSSWDWIPRKS